ELAADAGRRIDQHDAVLGALEGGARRTHRDAGWRLAVEARARKVHGQLRAVRAHLVGVHAVEPRAVPGGAVGVAIAGRTRIAQGVPFLAARRTGMAADAGVEIDDEAELLAPRRCKRGHRPTPSPAACRLRSRSPLRLVSGANC